MALMSPADAMFMVPESREQPMHVGSLQLFDLPKGSGPHFLRELYEQAVAEAPVNPLFRRRAYRTPATLGQWAWKDDDQVDIEHHVRHSALPDLSLIHI